MNEKLTEVQLKRKILVINVILFAVSIALYLVIYLVLLGLFRVTIFNLWVLVFFVLEIVVFVLSVVATINTARNLTRVKGLGFCVTSLVLSFIPAVFGPIFFLFSLLSFR